MNANRKINKNKNVSVETLIEENIWRKRLQILIQEKKADYEECERIKKSNRKLQKELCDQIENLYLKIHAEELVHVNLDEKGCEKKKNKNLDQIIEELSRCVYKLQNQVNKLIHQNKQKMIALSNLKSSLHQIQSRNLKTMKSQNYLNLEKRVSALHTSIDTVTHKIIENDIIHKHYSDIRTSLLQLRKQHKFIARDLYAKLKSTEKMYSSQILSHKHIQHLKTTSSKRLNRTQSLIQFDVAKRDLLLNQTMEKKKESQTFKRQIVNYIFELNDSVSYADDPMKPVRHVHTDSESQSTVTYVDSNYILELEIKLAKIVEQIEIEDNLCYSTLIFFNHLSENLVSSENKFAFLTQDDGNSSLSQIVPVSSNEIESNNVEMIATEINVSHQNEDTLARQTLLQALTLFESKIGFCFGVDKDYLTTNDIINIFWYLIRKTPRGGDNSPE